MHSIITFDFDLNAIGVLDAPARALPVEITRTQLHHLIKFDVRLLHRPGTCHFRAIIFSCKRKQLRSASVAFRPDDVEWR